MISVTQWSQSRSSGGDDSWQWHSVESPHRGHADSSQHWERWGAVTRYSSDTGDTSPTPHSASSNISCLDRLDLIRTTFLHSLVISFPPKSNYLITFTLSQFLKSNKYRWGKRSRRSQIEMQDWFSNFALKTQRKFVSAVLCFPSSQGSIRRCGWRGDSRTLRG